MFCSLMVEWIYDNRKVMGFRQSIGELEWQQVGENIMRSQGSIFVMVIVLQGFLIFVFMEIVSVFSLRKVNESVRIRRGMFILLVF